MPKGVEHKVKDPAKVSDAVMRNSVMPKGVEHSEMDEGFLAAIACGIQ